MANTIFQIKRSELTAVPSSLEYGELAYSFLSDKLFIGDISGNPVVVGGNTYIEIINAATSSATADTLVKRDANGSFSANVVTATLVGNAATASKWDHSISINATTDATGTATFDGSANATLALTLATVNANVGTWGNATTIPTITVNEKGLVTAVSNTVISTSLGIAGDTGSSTINTGDTIKLLGGDGVTSSVSGNTATFDVDNTVIRTTGGQSIANGLTITSGGLSVSGSSSYTGDLNITGNLNVTGNTVYVNVTDLYVEDPLIHLANNNTADISSIGFIGQYGASPTYTGLFREPGTNDFWLFTGVTDSLVGTTTISPSANGFTTANLHANMIGGTISGLDAPIAVVDGGTGANTFASGQILIGNGTGPILSLANVSAINTSLANNQTVANLTTDAYGRVTGFTVKDISELTIAQGGTGASSFTTGQMIISDGSKLISVANTGTAGTYGNNAYVPVVTTDGFGRVSSVTPTLIQIDASQVTSGILPIARGGTNSDATPTAGGLAYGNGSSILVTSAGTAGQAVLSNGTNAPSFGTLDMRGGGLGFTSANTNSVVFYSGSGNAMSSTNTPSDGYVLQYSTAGGVAFGMLDGGTF